MRGKMRRKIPNTAASIIASNAQHAMTHSRNSLVFAPGTPRALFTEEIVEELACPILIPFAKNLRIVATPEKTTKMNTPQISCFYVHWLHDYVREQGASPETVLGPLSGKETKPFYPMGEWGQLLELASQALRDPDLGLNFGRTITPHRFGVLGYLLHHCDTLGHAFARMQQYQRLLFHLQNSCLDKVGAHHRLSWQLGTACPNYHEETFTLASVLQFARTLTGQPIRLAEAGLMNDASVETAALRDFMQCPLRFAQPMTSMSHDLSLLTLVNVKPDAALRAILEEQANALLGALPRQDEFIIAVRRCIVSLLQEGEPTLARVAARLHLSARTLHRRLAERRLRFRELLDATRRELAESYLQDGRLSLAEVALLLGYAEQSPFTHAFKRWTGSTPFDWRKRVMLPKSE